MNDLTLKDSRVGKIKDVLAKYSDGFPKIVQIKWKGSSTTTENVVHPKDEVTLREGLTFCCKLCNTVLVEIFDPAEENFCQSCGSEIWVDYSNTPIMVEPKLISKLYQSKTTKKLQRQEKHYIKPKKKPKTSSKFNELDRVNWGASPGARSIMLDDSFSKMRLYKIEHPAVAKYLKILREKRGISISKLEKKYPKSYKHTIGHWFRTDFGGSIPIPSDIKTLSEKLGYDPIWKILERTALKLQIVKTSLKGKNPGDFLEGKSDKNILEYLKKLYIPSDQYLKEIER